ncbi:MAG: hypothetical protein RRZ64_00380 [Rikenellaceae bacterium]
MKYFLLILLSSILLLGCSKSTEDDPGELSEFYGYISIKNGSEYEILNVFLDKETATYQVIAPGITGERIGCKSANAKIYYSWSSNPTKLSEMDVFIKSSETTIITITVK